MRERPILFSAPMVRALLNSSKTQTRRIIKPQPITHPGMGCERLVMLDRKGREVLDTWIGDPMKFEASLCPYGQPGDQLWVRETWADVGSTDPGLTVYRADYPVCVPAQYENVPPADAIKWKPSVHMFRAASRITLEIISVRVERLQDISEADCYAEGIQISCDQSRTPLVRITGKFPPTKYLVPGKTTLEDLARAEYASLWESINGPGSWAANPWVWRVEFKRVKP
jgi:hypothetical protein